MDILKEKRELREKIIEKARCLPKGYTTEADKKICEAVIGLPEYQRANTVFCFVGRDAEIDTRPILEDVLRSGKRLCVPKCIAKSVMEARRIEGFEDLAPAKFGLLEPVDACETVLPSGIDFIVVPCATCNTSGCRLGFGGGYYDNYLSAAGAFTCMICRDELLCEEIPMESHDFIPNMLITEKRTVITGRPL